MENAYYKLIPNITKKEIRESYERGLKNGFTKSELILRFCQLNNLVFDQTIIKSCRDISDYMRKIHSLKQYEDKVFVDSVIFLKDDKKEFSKDLLDDQLDSFVFSREGLSVTGNCTVKLNLLSALQNEQQKLLIKMEESMGEGNIGTYKNLILALKEITYLVQKEEEKIKNSEMYIDFGRDVSYIYFNGIVYSVDGDDIVEKVVNQVRCISGNERLMKIFVDGTAYGSLVYDILKYREGFENTKYIFINKIN